MEVRASLANLLHGLLSAEELEQINQQLEQECRKDSQVLWTGVARAVAQAWADKRNLQTLTTAMGPLMDTQHSSCLKRTKTHHQWSSYIKGASALFAYHITRQSSKVIVLSPPPPEKLNPNGYTNYQLIEEPILKGMISEHSVECIQMVHPTVVGAEEFEYQSWPVNRTEDWTNKFSHLTLARTSWRTVKINPVIQQIIAIVTIAGKDVFFTESVTNLPPHVAEGVTDKRKQKDLKPAVAQSQDRTHIVVKRKKAEEEEKAREKARDEKIQRKKANKERAKQAQEQKARRKKDNEEKEEKARKAKAEIKKANKEKAEKARKAKAEIKKANKEKAEKARKEKAQKKEASKKAKRKRVSDEAELRVKKLHRG